MFPSLSQIDHRVDSSSVGDNLAQPFDVGVIGAGIAGLVCAQELRHAGYRVVVLEKSRGLGGRIATRRIQETWADHGLPYLQDQGELSHRLIAALVSKGLLKPWLNSLYQLDQTGLYLVEDQGLRYVAPGGLTAIAKFLAQGLLIYREQRVCAIAPAPEQHWHLRFAHENSDPLPDLQVQALATAIPAPQVLPLIEAIAPDRDPSFWAELQTVQFNPCLAVIAVYTDATQLEFMQSLSWHAVRVCDSPDLAWVSDERSKRDGITPAVFVFHSTPTFADAHLDVADVQPMGQHLLDVAAQQLSLPFNQPAIVQAHRWRYATPMQPFEGTVLSSDHLPRLVCGGDWCGGKGVEDAIQSGLAIAEKINSQFKGATLPRLNWLLPS